MEENKVAIRARLKIVLDAYDGNTDKQADAILQSPDLRVTLVEPRYRIEMQRYSSDGRGIEYWAVMDDKLWRRHADNLLRCDADDVCEWLNSKEPK